MRISLSIRMVSLLEKPLTRQPASPAMISDHKAAEKDALGTLKLKP